MAGEHETAYNAKRWEMRLWRPLLIAPLSIATFEDVIGSDRAQDMIGAGVIGTNRDQGGPVDLFGSEAMMVRRLADSLTASCRDIE